MVNRVGGSWVMCGCLLLEDKRQVDQVVCLILIRSGVRPGAVGAGLAQDVVGGSVGWVGDANLVPRWRPNIAAALALGGEYMGNRLILTDCGSASPQGPMPLEMVKAVAETISVPYIVGGGIRKVDEAESIVKAGANAIQIGTAMERSKDVKSVIGKFKKAIKDAPR